MYIQTSCMHNTSKLQYILAEIAYSNVAGESPNDIEQYVEVWCQSKTPFNVDGDIGVSIAKHNNSHYEETQNDEQLYDIHVGIFVGLHNAADQQDEKYQYSIGKLDGNNDTMVCIK